MHQGIQLTMSTLAFSPQSRSSIRYPLVCTTSRYSGAGGSSTVTWNDDVTSSSPLRAFSFSTYAPGAEKEAAVTTAAASAKVTSPGPDSLDQVTVTSGSSGEGVGSGASRRLRNSRGGSPYPAQLLM